MTCWFLNWQNMFPTSHHDWNVFTIAIQCNSLRYGSKFYIHSSAQYSNVADNKAKVLNGSSANVHIFTRWFCFGVSCDSPFKAGMGSWWMFQGGVSAELLAQKERLKKKMQQQIRKTYKVGSHFLELLLPLLRIWIRDPSAFWPLDLDPG